MKLIISLLCVLKFTSCALFCILWIIITVCIDRNRKIGVFIMMAEISSRLYSRIVLSNRLLHSRTNEHCCELLLCHNTILLSSSLQCSILLCSLALCMCFYSIKFNFKMWKLFERAIISQTDAHIHWPNGWINERTSECMKNVAMGCDSIRCVEQRKR